MRFDFFDSGGLGVSLYGFKLDKHFVKLLISLNDLLVESSVCSFLLAVLLDFP